MSSHAVRKEFTVERQAKIRQREREIQKLMGRAGEISTALDPTGITNAELMDEIRLLRQELQEAVSRNQVVHQAVKSSDGEDDDRDVRYEIALMVKVIARAKSEIASIKHPMADSDRMEDASSELDEIIRATEHATHQILEANETIETLIHELARSHQGDEEVLLATDKIACQIIKVLKNHRARARQSKPIERFNNLGKKPISDKCGAQSSDRVDCWYTGKARGQRTVNHRLDCEMHDNGRFVDGVNLSEVDKRPKVAGDTEALRIDFGVDEQASKFG